MPTFFSYTRPDALRVQRDREQARRRLERRIVNIIVGAVVLGWLGLIALIGVALLGAAL